jgi:hypothetical protein
MDALLKLAQDSGMSEAQGETATGGIFSFLKENISADQFSKIEEQMPGVDGAVDKYASGDSGGSSGGMFGSAMPSFGSSGGGASGGAGGLAGLMTTLTSKGINPSMLQKFMPQVSALIKSKCGVDVSQYLGGAAAAPSSGGASSGGAGGMMGQAMGMFGK